MNSLEIIALIKQLNIPFDVEYESFSFLDNIVLLSHILSYIVEEFQKFYGMELNVSPITDENERMSLYIEISGVLREIECPYSVLLQGNLEERFSTEASINLLLTFLLTELMSTKINATLYPATSELTKVKIDISDDQASLTPILKPSFILLGVNKPPDNITVNGLFTKLRTTLSEKLPFIPKHFLGKSLMSQVKQLTEEQWKQVDFLINSINDDYTNRKQTLIHRFDVTVQSLKWSPESKNSMDKIMKAFTPIRMEMDIKCSVTLVDLLASRDNPLTIYEKTCSGLARDNSKCKLNRLMIGKVPDRGGRPLEMEPPPPEIPSFQKRDNTNQQPMQNASKKGNRDSGYQNQGDRGGYQGDRGGYQGDRGGYQGDRGGYQNNRGYQGDRGGYQGDRGGYQGNRGGYQNDRGGYQGNRNYHGQEVYQNRRDSRGEMNAQNYRDQPDKYAQSVAPNNFFDQNSSQNFTPQFQPQSGNYRKDGRRGY